MSSCYIYARIKRQPDIAVHLFIRRIQRDFFLSVNAKKCNSVRVSQREATVDQLRGWSEVKKVS